MRTQPYTESELSDHIAIGAVIENDKGDVLCFKHVRWDFWTFPVGKSDGNETAEEATIREMQEELGITPTKLSKIYELQRDYIRNNKTVRVRLVLYRVLKYEGEIKNAEPDKHLKFGYESIEKLAQKSHLSDMLMIYLDKLKIPYKSNVQWFGAAEDDVDVRLDIYISQNVGGINRSMAQKLIESGKVLTNNEPKKSNYRLKMNDVIGVEFDKASLEDIPEINLPIVYEDDDCIVINKPAGVLTHSKGAFNPEGTVASFISKKINFPVDGNRYGIVHRLDRGTSGVIICAKNPKAMSWLQKQFSQRKVKKTYMAVIDKPLRPEHAIIDMPIERNPKKPQTFRVGNNGKSAITEYQIMESNDDKSLVKLQPKTGRTHQLRVHLESRDCPIVGDILYGGAPAERMFLHAESLELTLPSKERMIFTVELPKEFRNTLV